MLLLIPFALFLALALAAYTVMVQVDERATIRATLRQLDGYDKSETTIRDQELAESFVVRILSPSLARLVQLGRRIIPVDYKEKTRVKLVKAGSPSETQLDRFLAIRVTTIAFVPVAAVLSFAILPLGQGRMPLAVFSFLALASILGPDAMLNRRIAERQHAMRVKLPDILDLLTISVEAGLGFEQALDRTVSAVPGPLSDEFGRMLGEVRAGSSRADALRALDERTGVDEIRSFVLALLQADTFGVSIGRVLRAQADEMRVRRRQMAQEEAQKAPVKMLIPMVFCIFPSLFVVIIGPAVINIAKTLGGGA